jgi:hypothetical protein
MDLGDRRGGRGRVGAGAAGGVQPGARVGAAGEPGGLRRHVGLATGVSGFLGGALAGPLLLALQRVDVTVLGARPSAYVWLFAVALVLRTQGWWWLRGVPEEGAGRPGLLLRAPRLGLRGPRLGPRGGWPRRRGALRG